MPLIPNLSGIFSFPRKSVFIFLALFFCYHIKSHCQTNNNDLKTKSFETLKKLYDEIPGDSLKLKEVFAKTYIEKARNKKDTINMARGYYFFSTMYSDPLIGIKYADTIINLTNQSDDPFYPAVGYFVRGYWHYQLSDYQNALHDYLKGDSVAKIRGNKVQQLQNRKMIAALKNRSGDFEGALAIHKEMYLLEKTGKDTLPMDTNLMNTIFNLSLTYLHLKQLDSARIYAQEGIRESLRVKDTIFYNDFTFELGTIEYYDENFEKSLKHIDKVIPHVDNYSRTMAYYYKGKIYEKKGKNTDAINYFEKADSLANILSYTFPELRNSYESMVSYYEKQDNLQQQLLYINKILKLDSSLRRNKDLGLDIVNYYDTPLLLDKKEKLIRGLKKRNQMEYVVIIILTIIAIILISLIVFYKRKQKKYLKNYQRLLSKSANQKTLEKNIENEKLIDVLPLDVYNKISKALLSFENNRGYLNNITLNGLAKKLNTNTSYLSKIINHKVGKNFSQYLNDLRIAYIVNKLKEDEKLRSYTVSAIAEEAGYGTAQSFSKAFYNQTGIYPSYFIKKLNNR